MEPRPGALNEFLEGAPSALGFLQGGCSVL